MAGPHVDNKKSGSANCARRETAAVQTVRDEDLNNASYNIQRIRSRRSRRTSCSELFDCMTELPSCVSTLLDPCWSVTNDQ